MIKITAKTERLLVYTLENYRKQLQAAHRLAWLDRDQERAHKISKLLCQVMAELYLHKPTRRK
jgi:hypothetical protein